MSRTTIEVDVDIEDFIDELDTAVLFDECLRRVPKTRQQRMKWERIKDSFHFEEDFLIDKIISTKKLSLIQALRFKDFIENEL